MKKVIKIIGICLLISLSICVCVLYAIYPNQTKSVTEQVWATLNTPLPIVGVTTVAILIFLWQVIVKTNYGKKALAKIQKEYEEKYNALLEEKEKIMIEKENNQKEIEYLRSRIIDVCKTIPNVKVNKIGQDIEQENEYGNE
ncbi:MAG: hypothetical protein J6S85_20865 [Methanobrevibacter sp.]|nr:hypothetical protein [Methanobrevibacter sp.]